jgi:N-acetylglucosamine-6-phosphate deacetylase
MHGLQLWPGFIDQHIHGIDGVDFMDGDDQALHHMAEKLPLEGTTSFLATTMTENINVIEKALGQFKQYTHNQGARPLGIHLEGPFINKIYKGAQREDAIIEPSLAIFNNLNDVSGNNIKQITFAPENETTNGFIQHLVQKQVVCSIGHSDASSIQTQKAVNDGALCFTHAYNAMRPLHHRDIGVVGTMFKNKHTYAEIICDFVHTSVEAVQLLYQIKTADHIILITDAMRAKLLKDGIYNLGGQDVIVKGLEARLLNGTLAGSVLRMIDAVKNMKKATQCTNHELIKMSSSNSAKLQKIDHKKGSIEIDKDSDFVVLDHDLNIIQTYCEGIAQIK